MSSSNLKLRAAGALAVLTSVALAVSCQGFFPKATLQSIALQPPTPTFSVGLQQPMQAWGTNSNNGRSQITTGVLWQLSGASSGTVATIDPNSGTMTGVNAGTITWTSFLPGTQRNNYGYGCRAGECHDHLPDSCFGARRRRYRRTIQRSLASPVPGRRILLRWSRSRLFKTTPL